MNNNLRYLSKVLVKKNVPIYTACYDDELEK